MKKLLSLLLSIIMILGICNIPVTASDFPDASITVPNGTELYVGIRDSKHFVTFTEIIPSAIIDNTYYFELENDTIYNYRVSSEDYITYAGTFTKTADFNMNITEEILNTEGKNKKSVDRDTSSNNGFNTADIYLNINSKGHLKLNLNETYQIVNLRSWEPIDNYISNYFIEPDYHYTVIDENGNESDDVVTVNDSGLITAVGKGTAIILVTYDAINLNYGIEKEFYSAIWPENTGVIIVSVDAEENGIKTEMLLNTGKNDTQSKLSGDYIDAEHDCIYYIGENGTYTFTPDTDSLNIYAANISEAFNGFEKIDENEDKSFTVPLKEGRNIIKAEKDGNAEYQVITAKKVNITVNNGEPVHPGDTLNIIFDTLYHPANKLAGVYNMNAQPIYTDVSAYEGKLIGGLPGQYDFASKESTQTVANILKERDEWGAVTFEKDIDLTVPDSYEYDTFTLSDGMVYCVGWGDPYGNHRGITYTNGKAENNNADPKTAWLGCLPDIEIPITKTAAELVSISLDTSDVNTSCYIGDTFDTSKLIVTANYADETTQISTNYTVTPEIITKDTEKIIIEYRGKTAEIPVNVIIPKVTAIELTAPPIKTSYIEGEVFNPTGMIITALYENGTKAETTDYMYAPNRVLETTDNEITVTYSEGEIEPISIPVTVNPAAQGDSGSGTVSNKITVSFTLYGDKKHGESVTHTLKDNNLDKWVSKTSVTVDKGSYVIDAIIKALSIEGIPYTYNNGYITSIRGLKEFDNGSLSGWMYTLNGEHPTLGVDKQILKNGDSIVFHYTDDYTAERSSVIGTISGSGSISSTSKDKTTDNAKKEEIEVIEDKKPVFSEKTFNDVSSDDWHYKAVQFVYENGIMEGTNNGFEPDSNMTRAMLVTTLYRLENEPTLAGDDDRIDTLFTDIEKDSYYSNAVAWATENNLVNGINKLEFAPNQNITREQLAVIIYRYAKMKGYTADNLSELSQFTDINDVSDWAITALKWANADGLINGTGDARMSPKDTATRAQVAAILMRFCEKQELIK